jgi:hypothetical protein
MADMEADDTRKKEWAVGETDVIMAETVGADRDRNGSRRLQ